MMNVYLPTFSFRISELWLVIVSLLLSATAGNATTTTLVGTIRDFKRGDVAGGHPDFQTYDGYDPGIVNAALGDGRKPVYASATDTLTTTGKSFFDQWYRDVPGVNLSIPFPITLDDSENPGTYKYRNDEFLPINGQLFGDEGIGRNFHFTYDAHANFTYFPGQFLFMSGDDDVWVFINNTLTVDFGGVHPAQSSTIDLDTLGLTTGETYAFDLFFAERHTFASTLRIETSAFLKPFLPGDYNNNDIVDAADYTVWRNSLSTAVTLLNETETLNVVSQEDYSVWKMHFGETIPAGAGSMMLSSSSKAIPEAMTCATAIIAILIVISRRGHRHPRTDKLRPVFLVARLPR